MIMQMVRGISLQCVGRCPLHGMIFGFVFALGLLGCDGAPTESGLASVRVSLGQASQHLSAQTAASHATNLPPDITSVLITIQDTKGSEYGRGDLLDAGTVSFDVPAGIALQITGSAYEGDVLIYQGVNDVAPLKSGISQSVFMELLPAGTITHKILRDVVQVDSSVTDEPGNDASGLAMFSADNRLVAFHSKASNLTEADDNDNVDFFIKNLVSGDIINAHTDAEGNVGNGELTFADISGQADLVVFASKATNLVPGDSNDVSDIFLKDLTTGSIRRLSLTVTGQQLSFFSAYPSMSDDGGLVTFYTDGSLTEDGRTGVFLIDPSAAEPLIHHVDEGWQPRISADGNWVVYRKVDSDQLWLYDVVNKQKQLVNSYTTAEFPYHNINASGQFVVFHTADDGLDPNDQNGLHDVYLYDRLSHSLRWISTDRSGSPLSGSAGGAILPSVSNDGRYVVFSYGTTIYVKDAVEGELAALADPGINAVISPDGELIAYTGISTGNLYVAPNPLFVQAAPDTVAKKPVDYPIIDDTPYIGVSIVGTGGGTVSSSDNLINCGNDCSESYANATTITLTAMPDDSSMFAGWSGNCSGQSSSVDVVVDRRRSCTATFTSNVTPPTPEPGSGLCPRFQPGDSWEYTATSRFPGIPDTTSTHTDTVTENTGSVVTMENVSSQGSTRLNSLENIDGAYYAMGWEDGFGSSTLVGPERFPWCPAPEINAKMRFEHYFDGVLISTQIMTVVNVAAEAVTVTAGTFSDAVRIDIQAEITYTDTATPPSSYSESIYLADQVGWVKTTSSFDQGSTESELVSCNFSNRCN